MRLATSERVVEIPLSLIDDSPTNPREKYDERALAELAQTINSVGLVQPVVVRPNPQAKERFELVFGSRRRRASIAAGKDTIPSIVRDLSDQQVLELQFIENEARENLSPLSQARGYAALMKTNPTLYTVEEITARLGKSDNRYVAERLQLLQLIEPAQKLLDAERLPYRHAFEISRLQAEQQEKALRVCFGSFQDVDEVFNRPFQTVSVNLEALRQWITTHCHLDLRHAPFPLDEPIASEIPCRQCPKRAGSAPLLFSDIATEDTCLDPPCYIRKKDALVQIQVGQLQEKGLQVARISNALRVGAPNEKPDVLYRGEYRVVGRDSCDFAQPGVYDEGATGEHPVYICREESCPVHAGRTRFATAEDKEERKQRVKDQREEKRYRADLLAAIRDKVSKIPQKPDLYLIACRFLQLMPHADRVATFRLFNWTESKSPNKRGAKHVDYVELGKAQLAKLGTYELQRFLIVASLTPDLSIPDADPKQTLPTTSTLAQTAKRLGIAPKTVRASARKALKEAAGNAS
jgi:ParB family transcriptional regulator, chromosome partitioning protein